MPSLTREGGAGGGGLLRAVSLTRSLRLMLWRVLPSVAARPPPEEPAEEPAERLQPDGAAGGQRLAAPDRGLHAQPHPDHGRGQCPHVCRLQLRGLLRHSQASLSGGGGGGGGVLSTPQRFKLHRLFHCCVSKPPQKKNKKKTNQQTINQI